ncbi:glycosyltransferase, partial [Actinophytocola sp.]|uniref:glycosyltransferase n=1 Tax=Actinophytocola sp. TaxID=1872138 RepID=UPI002D7E4E38
MRYAFWTPLPPERSGIADYAYQLLAELGMHAEVVAVSRNPATASPPPGIAVVRPETAARPGVLPVYQMGNHAGAHAWIYRQALADPGMLVLHDTSLLGFHFQHLGGIAAERFRREVDFAHGPIWGDPHDPALYEGWPALEVDGVKTLDGSTLRLERRLVEASLGVIVHDPYSAQWLRARYPDRPVHVVPHGVATTAEQGPATVRADLGWQDDHLVFGIYGGFNPIKRMLVAVLAFAQIRRHWPTARLIIAGHLDYPEVLAEVRRTIAEHGLADSVHIALAPGEREFAGLIGAADVVVNLRWPTAGETSGVMMRAFGAGRVVITSDLPQHRHLDPDYCWRVPIEPAAEAEALLNLMDRAVCWPEDVRAAGARARAAMGETSSWRAAAEGYLRALEPAEVGTTPVARVRAAVGVNVFADMRATTGLSESARRHTAALLEAGVDLTLTEFNSRAPNRSVPVPERLTGLRSGKDHPIDLWLLNLNEFQLIPEHAMDRYSVALWAWELPDVLEYSIMELPRIDELWVVSSFVAEAFRTVTDMPITVVPNVVTQSAEIRPDRARFGLPEDGLVVLFSFSASSSDARKNPWGVIEAFRRAFPPDERGTRAHLVLKVIDLHEFPELTVALTDATDSVRGTIIAEDLTRDEMDSLLASCDIYVSLHRSEGFGMGMAEAMAMGKPVIATGYGGNTDFMPPGAAAVVGYDIRPITKADHRFGAKFGGW